MLTVYALTPTGLVRVPEPLQHGIGPEAVWIDLFEPTLEEEKAIEAQLGIDVPTREEMSELEASNRLYEEHGAVYLTCTIVTKLDSDLPQPGQITFILKDGRLVTNRYCDPLPFRRFVSYAEKHPASCQSGINLLAGLAESIINRVADAVEKVGTDLDTISAAVFAPARRAEQQRLNQHGYRRVLERVGQSGALIAKTRESLVSLGRLLTYVQQSALVTPGQEVRNRLRTLARDAVSLSDHASFLGSNVSFILDATLGLISIEQNNILKIFSVATVALLPPSVIGAIYGMNFEHIPWAHESWGFLGALGLMFVSAAVPLMVFKRRGWL